MKRSTLRLLFLSALILITNFFFSNSRSITKEAEAAEGSVFSLEEKNKCEEVISKVITAFKEKNYIEAYKYYYIPPYYNADDKKADSQYIVGLLKIFYEGFGDLETYSPISFEDVPDKFMWYGEKTELMKESVIAIKNLPKHYMRVFKAHFGKFEQDLYIYIAVCIWKDQAYVRLLGLIVPSPYDYLFGSVDTESDAGEPAKLSRAYFQIKEYYKLSGENKIKALADTAPGKSHGVSYLLPTQEGEDVIFRVDYDDAYADATIQSALFYFDNKLAEKERVFNLVNKENALLKIQFWFSDDGSILKAQVIADPPAKDVAKKEKIFHLESKGGFIIKGILTWEHGELYKCIFDPEIIPFIDSTEYVW